MLRRCAQRSGVHTLQNKNSTTSIPGPYRLRTLEFLKKKCICPLFFRGKVEFFCRKKILQLVQAATLKVADFGNFEKKFLLFWGKNLKILVEKNSTTSVPRPYRLRTSPKKIEGKVEIFKGEILIQVYLPPPYKKWGIFSQLDYLNWNLTKMVNRKKATKNSFEKLVFCRYRFSKRNLKFSLREHCRVF